MSGSQIFALCIAAFFAGYLACMVTMSLAAMLDRLKKDGR